MIETEILQHVNDMCIESLSPNIFEKWEAVKEGLLLTRKSLYNYSMQPYIEWFPITDIPPDDKQLRIAYKINNTSRVRDGSYSKIQGYFINEENSYIDTVNKQSMFIEVYAWSFETIPPDCNTLT